MSHFDMQHALAVARKLRGDPEAWLAGLLHDAIEDGGVDYRDLLVAGVPEHVCDAVYELTRRQDESYDDYIERLTELPPGDLARRVKVADLEANLARMDADHESLAPRYQQALGAFGSEAKEAQQ